MSNRRVLVIEQGLDVQSFLFAIRDRSWQVMLARSLDFAVSVLGRGLEFDLVAVDEGPEEGHRFWQSIRLLTEASRPAPVLLFTDRTTTGKHTRAQKAGLAGLVAKPSPAFHDLSPLEAGGSAAAAGLDTIADSR